MAQFRIEPKTSSHTVDGSEIRLSPVEVGSLPYYLPGFIPGWCRISSINSTSSGLVFGCLGEGPYPP